MISLEQIARLVNGERIGPDAQIAGVACLEEAESSQLSLCVDSRRADVLKRTRAVGVLLPKKSPMLRQIAPCTVILVDQPRLALKQVLEFFHPEAVLEPGIGTDAWVHPQAMVDKTVRIEPGARIDIRAKVGARSWIQSGAYIGPDARIGENCRIGVNAVVSQGCVLGSRVVLGPCAVIGSMGFGMVQDGKAYGRIPQIGTVIIGDDVEIGAGSTVDRGTLGATRIGMGTKIDNLVQVGHNVVIGDHVIIAAQVGLSGSAKVETGAVLGGQVGVADRVVIGSGAQVGAKSGVGTNVAAGVRVVGYPAMPVQRWLESVWLLRRLRKMFRRSHADRSLE